MKIPKLIWQTWKTRDVPSHWEMSPKSMKQKHPGWDYRLYTDEDNRNFVKKYFNEYLEMYDSFPKGIYRADTIRYMRLYIHGGVYADLDIKARKSFQSLFENGMDVYFVCTPNVSGYTNSFMASKPGHKIWLNILKEIKKRYDNCPWWMPQDLRVLWMTGPMMVTSVLKETHHVYGTIPYKLCHPCDINDHYFGRSLKKKGSYVEELPGSSWTSPMVSVWHFLYCRWRELIVFSILLLLIVIILKTK